MKQHSMTSMLDLSKAYERVSHAGLVAAARRHGFRLRRLKLILRSYGGRRRLCLSKWVSEAFSLGTSI
eukprot:1318767-Pyramimonas_sp.AAC.1